MIQPEPDGNLGGLLEDDTQLRFHSGSRIVFVKRMYEISSRPIFPR
jgi:hypothetical protein